MAKVKIEVEGLTWETPSLYWVCTYLANGEICGKPAILYSDAYGLCLAHALKNALPIPPIADADPFAAGNLDQIAWELDNKHGDWLCTISGCGADAAYKPNHKANGDPWCSAGLCADHAPYYLPPGKIVDIHAGVDKMSTTLEPQPEPTLFTSPAGTVWTTTPPTHSGWLCTAKAFGCGKLAVLIYGLNGLCAAHATEENVLPIISCQGDVNEIPWELKPAANGWVCTVQDGHDCGAPALLWPSKVLPGGQGSPTYENAGLCAAHAPWYVPPATLSVICSGAIPSPKVAAVSKVLSGAHTGSPFAKEKSIVSQIPTPSPKTATKAAKARKVPKPKDGLIIPFAADYGYMSGDGDTIGDTVAEIVDPLGLKPKLKLSQAAAEWYLLMDASLCKPSPAQAQAKADFDKLTAFLAHQFVTYIECATLGEARYAAGHVHGVEEARFLKTPKWRAIYNDVTCGHKDRYAVWRAFPEYARQHGRRNLLLFVVLVHGNLKWGTGKHTGFGGLKWATCAKVALAYRRHKLTAEQFVDTAFGLKHNGNIVFDKLWNVGSLQHVLDINLAGGLDDLTHYAAADVAKLWKEANNVESSQAEKAESHAE